MKNLICVVIMGILFTGCAGFQMDDSESTEALLRIVSRQIGCEAALSEDPEIDRAMRNAYTLAKTGELSQDGLDQLNETLSKHVDERPTLISNSIDLLSIAGVRFDLNGQAVGLGEISPEMFKAVESGYLSGFKLCGKQ